MAKVHEEGKHSRGDRYGRSSPYDHPDKPGEGAARRRALHLSPKEDVRAVMGEFKRGHLRSGSGEHVKNRKQAIAIAMSESGQSTRNKR